MTELLPTSPSLAITRVAGPLTRKKQEKLDHLLILIPDKMPTALWKKLPEGSVLQRFQRRIGNKAAFLLPRAG